MMNKYKYSIANVVFSSEYKVCENNKFDKNIKCNEKIQFEMSKLESRITIHGIDKYQYNQYCKDIFTIGNDVMLVSKKWDIAYILYPFKNKENALTLLLQMFYTHAVQRRMIQLHSSLISHQNHGIMFLGPSGIGKTTQAELWQKYRSSLIINGDIVFVQETDSGFLGWGTPWHGSSPYCENTSVPLKAMVVLKQSDQNSIRELTGFEKVTEVSNSVFYPQWLENGMELCLETLDHLLISIPVYELRCRPDEDAVRLTEQTIFS